MTLYLPPVISNFSETASQYGDHKHKEIAHTKLGVKTRFDQAD